MQQLKNLARHRDIALCANENGFDNTKTDTEASA